MHPGTCCFKTCDESMWFLTCYNKCCSVSLYYSELLTFSPWTDHVILLVQCYLCNNTASIIFLVEYRTSSTVDPRPQLRYI